MLFAVLTAVPSYAAQSRESVFAGTDWTAFPNVFEINREPAYTGFIPYDIREKAFRREKENSSYYQLLNGKWYFACGQAGGQKSEILSDRLRRIRMGYEYRSHELAGRRI